MKESTKETIFISMVLSVPLAAVLIPTIFLGVSAINSSKANDARDEIIINTTNALIETNNEISSKANLKDFSIQNISVLKDTSTNQYELSTIGTSTEETDLVKKRIYSKAMFSIDKQTAQDLYDAIMATDCGNISEEINIKDISINSAYIDGNPLSKEDNLKQIEKFQNINKIYTVMLDAVKNSISCSSEKLTELSSFRRSLDNELNITSPNVVPSTYINSLYATGGTTYKNQDIRITSLSGIQKNYEKNESYFIIKILDPVLSNGCNCKRYENKCYVVTFEGTEKSNSDYYEIFCEQNGGYKFEEVESINENYINAYVEKN